MLQELFRVASRPSQDVAWWQRPSQFVSDLLMYPFTGAGTPSGTPRAANPAAGSGAAKQMVRATVPKNQPPGPPTMPTMPSFEELIGGAPGGGSSSFGMSTQAGIGSLAAAQRQAAQALGSLEAQFQQRKQELREQYQLSETEEERVSIQHLLAVIEAQRDAGTQVIERVYGQAIEDAATRSSEVRQEGVEFGARQAETFNEAADDASQMLSDLNREFGGAMGVASRPLSQVAESAIANMLQQGQIERAFDERMFNLTADDIAFLGEAMRPEMGAQVGGLQRLAAQTSARAQAQHDMEVNRRIAQERANMQNAMFQLSGMFDQRRFGLEDQQIALLAQAAEMEAANARQAASLRASSAGRLSPEQEWRLRMAERQHEADMMNYQREAEIHRQRGALQDFGVNRREANLATAMGLGVDLAEREILNPLAGLISGPAQVR